MSTHKAPHEVLQAARKRYCRNNGRGRGPRKYLLWAPIAAMKTARAGLHRALLEVLGVAFELILCRWHRMPRSALTLMRQLPISSIQESLLWEFGATRH